MGRSARRVVVSAVVVGGLLVTACSNGDEPAADDDNGGGEETTTTAVEDADVTIGPVTVSDTESADTVYEFTVDTEIPDPPTSLRCQLGHGEIVYTAAGTLVEEPSSGADFTLTVASAALDTVESLFPDPGVDMLCTAGGVAAAQTIDRRTGDVIEEGPEPTPDQIPSADAPALQIEIGELRHPADSTTVSLTVTVEGATEGSTLDCEMTDNQPQQIDSDSVELSGGTESFDVELDVTGAEDLVEATPYVIFVCEVDDVTAIETVDRPGQEARG